MAKSQAQCPSKADKATTDGGLAGLNVGASGAQIARGTNLKSLQAGTNNGTSVSLLDKSHPAVVALLNENAGKLGRFMEFFMERTGGILEGYSDPGRRFRQSPEWSGTYGKCFSRLKELELVENAVRGKWTITQLGREAYATYLKIKPTKS